MRPRSFVVLATLLLGVASTVIAPSASAYQFFPSACRWNATTVTYFNSAASPYATLINNAASAWNGRSTQAKLSRTTTFSARNFAALATNAGNTGWSGITRKPGTASSFPSCSFTRWDSGGMEIVLNTYYNSGSTSKQQGVIVHEFGHAFGLAHENTRTTGCATGAYVYKAIMYYSDDRFNGPCGIFTPQSDDVAGINALY